MTFKLILLFLIIAVLILDKPKINFIKKQQKNKIKFIFNKYTKEISNSREIFIKTGKKMDKKYLTDYYIKNVIDFNNIDIISIYKCLNFINKISNKYTLITSTNWNFIKLSNNLELNMPFTLENYIVLNEDLLNTINKSIYKKENITDHCEMLIHEKIHIYKEIIK